MKRNQQETQSVFSYKPRFDWAAGQAALRGSGMDAALAADFASGDIAKFGIGGSPVAMRELAQRFVDMVGTDAQAIKHYGMDDVTGGISTASAAIPAQFLRQFLPGIVSAAVMPRKIDEMIGKEMFGDPFMEEVVMTFVENTANSRPYGDNANTMLTNFNVNYERRTVVRMENGIEVRRQEEARNAMQNINAADAKRKGASMQLSLDRNLIGHVGWNSGANLTYGVLNAPNLSAYTSVPNGVSGTATWATKTFDEKLYDHRLLINQVRTQSGGLFDPFTQEFTVCVPTSMMDHYATPNSLGSATLMEVLLKTYPKMRVVNTTLFQSANAGANVIYVYAESIDDGLSTDNGQVWVQAVQSEFFTLGTEQKSKGYLEAYMMATAGSICKRPYAVARGTGI